MEKKLGNAGRVLFRYSGTEAVARIMIEGQNKDEIETMAQELSQQTIKSIVEYQTTNGTSKLTPVN